MVQTKFFTRRYDNLKEYKNNFKMALAKVKVIKLFNLEVIDFLNKWIGSQKNYIPREDVDNFLENMNFIYKNKDFYDFVVKNCKSIKNKGKIQEYSFNLISCLDDSKKDFEKYLKQEEKKKTLENDLAKSKQEDKDKIEDLEILIDYL